jgi:hypothetical protein
MIGWPSHSAVAPFSASSFVPCVQKVLNKVRSHRAIPSVKLEPCFLEPCFCYLLLEYNAVLHLIYTLEPTRNTKPG